MTPDQADKLLTMLALRDAQEALRSAAGWIVLVWHADAPERVLGAYGPFQEPAAALEAAARQEGELNLDGEEGFRCRVHPITPVT